MLGHSKVASGQCGHQLSRPTLVWLWTLVVVVYLGTYGANVCFFLPGVGGALWEAPSHSAGTHQDSAALPFQPEWTNTYHVLGGHHHQGRLNSSPPRLAPFHSIYLVFLVSPIHHPHPHHLLLPNSRPWSFTSSSNPRPFFFSTIDYSSPSSPSPFLTLSKTAYSAESLILSVPGLCGAFTFLYLLHSTSFSVCLFTSPYFIPHFCLLSFLFPLSLPSATPLSIALYLPPALALTVCDYLCLCVCVYFMPLWSVNPHRSCSVAHFPFPLIPSHLLLLHLFFLLTDPSTAALPSLPDNAAPCSVFMRLLPMPSLFVDRPPLIQKLFKFMLFDMCSPENGRVYFDVNAERM